MKLPKKYHYADCCMTCVHMIDPETYTGKCKINENYIITFDHVCDDFHKEKTLKLDS